MDDGDFWDDVDVKKAIDADASESYKPSRKVDAMELASNAVRFLQPVVAAVIDAIRGRQPDVLEELQIREAALRIEQIQGRSAAIIECGPEDAFDCIQAYVDEDGQVGYAWAWSNILIFGARGSGKSALTAWLGQVASGLGQDVRTVGMPPNIAERLGFSVYDGPLDKAENCVLLVEEAGLQYGTDRKKSAVLEKALSLARHNQVSMIWNTQNLSQMNRGILRHEATVCFKRLDPFAARFDREEAADLLTQVLAYQTGFPSPDPARSLVLGAAGWRMTNTPLPTAWSGDISRMHKAGGRRGR